MAVRDILTWPDPRLSEVCAPVTAGEDIDALVADLFATMYAAPGRGLAAPQIGVMKRVFVTDTTWKEGSRTPIAFINPRISQQSEMLATGDEGCLSIPGLMLGITRPEWVAMEWVTPDGDGAARRFDGFAAACVCHELDHLDGIVTLDHLNEAERSAAEAIYAAGRG
ncbi:MAG: peptide deformylase [Arenibacterium sp.]